MTKKGFAFYLNVPILNLSKSSCLNVVVFFFFFGGGGGGGGGEGGVEEAP